MQVRLKEMEKWERPCVQVATNSGQDKLFLLLGEDELVITEEPSISPGGIWVNCCISLSE